MNSNGAGQAQLSIDPQNIPAHVAIIMDGNGRWARSRLMNRLRGHEQGAQAVRRIVRCSRELGIRYLTLYAFSTENWQRPKSEVNALMTLLRRFLRNELPTLLENEIRLNVIGQVERLPGTVQEALVDAMQRTRENRKMQLNLALSYGGRSEILHMVRRIADKVQTGTLEVQDINEEVITRNLYTHPMPDPDILIRTSGEMRISNFLLWQIAYAEIFVTPTYWPDFSTEEYRSILAQFQQRDRRFGKIAPTDALG